MTRESILISYATPEDNGFVRWLGARLELAGFSAWHDLGRLKGGDYFWDKIEGAIRNESFRFLAVVSKVAVDKQGVKDEWALAQTIEKSMPGFVIPLRLDDYDFSLPPIESVRILGSEREIKLTDLNRRIPWFEHEDRIVGFAKAADLVSHMSKTVMLKAANGVASATLIGSGSTFGDKPVSAFEARKRVANLVRQAWELTMEAKDLGVHEQSGGRKVFYVTPTLTKGRGEKICIPRCRWAQAPQGAQRSQRTQEGQLVLRGRHGAPV